jgi:hypothetical protein
MKSGKLGWAEHVEQVREKNPYNPSSQNSERKKQLLVDLDKVCGYY